MTIICGCSGSGEGIRCPFTTTSRDTMMEHYREAHFWTPAVLPNERACIRGCNVAAVLDGLCQACWNAQVLARTAALKAAHPESFAKRTGTRDRRYNG